MVLQRHQDVVHGAGSVRHRDDEAGAVVPDARARQHLGMADDREAGPVVWIVLDRGGDDVQAVLAARVAAGERPRASRVVARQPCAFGIARNGTALDVR